MRIATRFSGPAQVSNAAATKYTVAANQKAIVRHIHIYNPSGSAVLFTMSIGADAAGVRIFDAMSIGPNQAFDHFCMYVLEETEVIQAFAGTNNILVLTIDGDVSILA
jgi:predicted amidohydrolase